MKGVTHMKKKRFEDYKRKREMYDEEFYLFFADEADQFWDLYEKHEKDGISYELMEMRVNYSATKLRELVKTIESFLDEPSRFLGRKPYPNQWFLMEKVYMPNEFIEGCYRLSLAGNRLFCFAILLYQHGLPCIVPGENLLFFAGKHLKNKGQRERVCKELREFKIKLKNGEVIKCFDLIEDRNGSIIYSFSEDALRYIDFFMRCSWLLSGLSPSPEGIC